MDPLSWGPTGLQGLFFLKRRFIWVTLRSSCCSLAFGSLARPSWSRRRETRRQAACGRAQILGSVLPQPDSSPSPRPLAPAPGGGTARQGGLLGSSFLCGVKGPPCPVPRPSQVAAGETPQGQIIRWPACVNRPPWGNSGRIVKYLKVGRGRQGHQGPLQVGHDPPCFGLPFLSPGREEQAMWSRLTV